MMCSLRTQALYKSAEFMKHLSLKAISGTLVFKLHCGMCTYGAQCRRLQTDAWTAVKLP